MNDGYAAPVSDADREGVRVAIEAWMHSQLADNPVVGGIEEDRSGGQQRWVIRVHGEDKEHFAIWFHLRQRTLAVETHFMPSPEENQALLFEHLLRRNATLHRYRFAIGMEDAVFLMTEVPLGEVEEDTLDWLFGAAYTYVEQFFVTAMRIGFASRFDR